MKRVTVSGGFDPVHIGHLQMLDDAKALGDHLTVILNSDKFLLEKKGYKIGIANILWIKPFKIKKSCLKALKKSKYGCK